MSYITGITRGRQEWTPRFVKAVDDNKCIGCGRCMKICAHQCWRQGSRRRGVRQNVRQREEP